MLGQGCSSQEVGLFSAGLWKSLGWEIPSLSQRTRRDGPIVCASILGHVHIKSTEVDANQILCVSDCDRHFVVTAHCLCGGLAEQEVFEPGDGQGHDCCG